MGTFLHNLLVRGQNKGDRGCAIWKWDKERIQQTEGGIEHFPSALCILPHALCSHHSCIPLLQELFALPQHVTRNPQPVSHHSITPSLHEPTGLPACTPAAHRGDVIDYIDLLLTPKNTKKHSKVMRQNPLAC